LSRGLGIAVQLIEPLELNLLQLTLKGRDLFAEDPAGLLGPSRPTLERVHIYAVPRPFTHFLSEELCQRLLLIRELQPLLEDTWFEARLARLRLH
jgi:hypothetical protein